MSKHIPRVAHLTSAHDRYDTRIFLKMCRSLAEAEYDVTLVVADGKGLEHKDGVRIVDVGARGKNRFDRMTTTVQCIYQKAVSLNAEIYHLHDPELIPAGLKLKALGKVVVFDAHEDLPKQLKSKPYLNPLTGRLLSVMFAVYERWTCRKFDAVISATPSIGKKFSEIAAKSVVVNNYPLLAELENSNGWSSKRREAVYVGAITKIRGIVEVVDALAYTSSVRLNLAGRFNESDVRQEIPKRVRNGLAPWDLVNELGSLNRDEVREILARSVVGVVTFLPVPNHVDSQPNKMFEYMSAGLPLVTSDFPLWREIVEGNDCGVCVDPRDPVAIGRAIQRLIDNPDLAQRLGDNGRRAIEREFNWSVESLKLLELYERLYL